MARHRRRRRRARRIRLLPRPSALVRFLAFLAGLRIVVGCRRARSCFGYVLPTAPLVAWLADQFAGCSRVISLGAGCAFLEAPTATIPPSDARADCGFPEAPAAIPSAPTPRSLFSHVHRQRVPALLDGVGRSRRSERSNRVSGMVCPAPSRVETTQTILADRLSWYGARVARPSALRAPPFAATHAAYTYCASCFCVPSPSLPRSSRAPRRPRSRPSALFALGVRSPRGGMRARALADGASGAPAVSSEGAYVRRIGVRARYAPSSLKQRYAPPPLRR